MSRLARSLPIAAFLIVLLVPSQAGAIYDPIGSGQTKLNIDRSFARLLAEHETSLIATGGAVRHGRSYTLPVTGGALDPTTEKGELEQEGTLVFERGARRVVLRNVVVKTRRQPLIAKVGGGQLKLLTAGKLSFTRAGFGSTFSASPLRLSAKLATRLAKKLSLHGVFEAGQLFGTVRSQAQPRTLAVLPSGRATFTPDGAFLAKLDSVFVSLNPIAPAERAAGPLFSFPIIGGGQLDPEASLGTLRTGGALEFLQLGAGQVFWTEPWFDIGAGQVLAEADLEPAPTFPGKLGQIPILALAPGAASSDPKARTVTLAGAPLSLNTTSAAHFNQAFAAGKEIFHAGEPLGTLTFTAQTQ